MKIEIKDELLDELVGKVLKDCIKDLKKCINALKVKKKLSDIEKQDYMSYCQDLLALDYTYTYFTGRKYK